MHGTFKGFCHQGRAGLSWIKPSLLKYITDRNLSNASIRPRPYTYLPIFNDSASKLARQQQRTYIYIRILIEYSPQDHRHRRRRKL